MNSDKIVVAFYDPHTGIKMILPYEKCDDRSDCPSRDWKLINIGSIYASKGSIRILSGLNSSLEKYTETPTITSSVDGIYHFSLQEADVEILQTANIHEGPCMVDIWGLIDGNLIQCLLFFARKNNCMVHPLDGHEWYDMFSKYPFISFN